ncbi:MAG TPA: FtsQ-type POTRA domain-containing protein [Ignavibacteriaceae bacterium]|nr:FtsQ-type POTRA domain-containing protein [Ignavibacteriaceae bacterium]
MKSETRRKILGLLLFVILIGFLFFLSIASERKELDKRIKSITMTGNKLLNENDYLAFIKLNDAENYKGLTLPVIKARLQKHPYVKRADVEFSRDNEVHINLTEKEIKAVLMNNNGMFLSSDNFEILPFIPNTKISNLPVISNLDNSDLLKKNEKLKTPGLVEAYKIIDAAGSADDDVAKKLSEINLRNGGDIILLFSGLKPPVIFGKGNPAFKIVAFDELISGADDQSELVMNSSFIDLRFGNAVYLGNNETTGLTE